MAESLHIVCPHCEALNRIPAGRLGGKPNCGQCHQPLFTAHPVALTAANFPRYVQRNDIPLLVDFWAPWCGPCLAMAPHFVEAAGLLEPQVRTAKVDTQAHQDLARQYQIRSIPTLILFRGGQELARQSGSMGSADIVRWVQARAAAMA